jgi:hypothetical protein
MVTGRNYYAFYTDDEGMSVNITLKAPKSSEVQFIYLEGEVESKHFIESIEEIIDMWDRVFTILIQEVENYSLRVYSKKLGDYEIEKIYISLDDHKGDFGVLIRYEIDVEHGIGVRFHDFKVQKVGGADVSFM